MIKQRLMGKITLATMLAERAKKEIRHSRCDIVIE